MPKKIVEKKTFWKCRTCGTRYTGRVEAEKCEKRSLEPKAFRIGDRVRARRKRMCDFRTYVMKGKIIKIVGPSCPDFEYEIKWIQIRGRIGLHVFEYIVEYHCPMCGKKKSAIYYAPELELIERKRALKSKKK